MKIGKYDAVGLSLQVLMISIGVVGISLLYNPSSFFLYKLLEKSSPYGAFNSQDIRLTLKYFAILFTAIGFLSGLSTIYPKKIISFIKFFRRTVSAKLIQKKANIAIASFLILLSFLVYFTSFHIGFFADDYAWLVDSEKNLKNISNIFSLSQSHFFKPVTHIYHATNFLLFGEKSQFWHLSGILFHGLVSFLLYLITLRLTRKNHLAVFSSILFCIYSVANRSVMWISGSELVFAGLLYLLSFYLFLTYLENKRAYHLILSICLFILGILAKESVVSLAPTIFLVGLLFGGVRSKLKGMPFVIIAVIYLIFQFLLQTGSFLVERGIYTFSPGLIIKNIYSYLFAAAIPQGHRLFYFFPQIKTLILVGELVLVIFLFIKGNNLVRFFLLWLIFLLLPYTPFNLPIQVRYLYLPSFAVCILLAWFLSGLYKNFLARSERGILTYYILTILIITGNILVINIAATRMKAESKRMETYVESIKNDIQKIEEIKRGKLPEDSPLAYDHLRAALKL